MSLRRNASQLHASYYAQYYLEILSNQAEEAED